MTAAWIVSWVAAGFILGVLYVLVLQAIFDGMDERRAHRARVERLVATRT